jgi:mannose-6-phosphate isomerase-like protein (cupin superfamily)
MDPTFNDIHTDPENDIFKVVFFPDRVYHAQYLNATRSSRYRYNVREVRSKHDVTVLKGQVFMDGRFLCNFMRIEYRAGRLVEVVREAGRHLRGEIMVWVKIHPQDERLSAEATIKMHFDRWIDAYQVEIWDTLEPPAGCTHNFRVLNLMGHHGSITRVNAFSPALKDVKAIRQVELAFRENDRDLPRGYAINNPQWDNNYSSSHQEPRVPTPSADQNTVYDKNYLIDFQRGWFIQDAGAIEPVRYLNGMMYPDNPDQAANNVIEMRWLIQRQLGSTVVFFHEVTIPPGAVEGTHRHIGSEELYYITHGQGIAYMGENDDPTLAEHPTVERYIYGLDPEPCKEVHVQPGSVIYTKSGGIHGIRNNGTEPLKFVAFLYHAT